MQRTGDGFDRSDYKSRIGRARGRVENGTWREMLLALSLQFKAGVVRSTCRSPSHF